MEYYKSQFIELAIAHQVLTFGDFTLKSGRCSPYFFNMGLFNTGSSLQALGEFYARAIAASNLPFDQLFGPAYKGIPLASSTAIAFSAIFKRDLPYSFNRKEAKDHGEGGLIVGAPLKGRVLIIDDVMTAGTAVREAIALVKQAGATVAGIVIALDRQEKGNIGQLSAVAEIEAEYHIPVVSIINLADLIAYAAENHQIKSDDLQALRDYRERYGVTLPVPHEIPR